MPHLLAIDTSTEACSVALYGGANLYERAVDAPREHVQRILPMIDSVLAENSIGLRDLDAIAFARGPGSFTGLRICLGIVQGLAYGANLPVLPVSTLAALAQTAVDKAAAERQNIAVGSYLCSAIDARMDEIYCGWFRVGADGLVVAASPEIVCKPEALPVIERPVASACYGIGTGWRYVTRLPQFAPARIDADLLPRASAVAKLALIDWNNGVRFAARDAQPVYLRNDVAWAKDPVWGKPGAI